MPTPLPDRYAKAESLLPHHTRDLITSASVDPKWIDGTDTFWYQNRTKTGWEFVHVDAEARAASPAFDHDAMAAALSPLLTEATSADRLPTPLEMTEHTARVVIDGQLVEVALDSYATSVLGPARQSEVFSPDGRWSVGVRDHNLYVRETATQQVRQVTTDGVRDHAYGGMTDAIATLVQQENFDVTIPPQVLWAPDSSRFVTHRIDQRAVESMHLVRSAPLDGGRPSLLSYHYAMVGDEHVATAELLVVDAASGDVTTADCAPLAVPYVTPLGNGFVWWNASATTVHFAWGDRGERTSRIHALDPETGHVTVLLEEFNDLGILYGPHYNDCNVRVLESGEVLVWSERSGFGHLYLHDPDSTGPDSGSVTALTAGDWVVRRIVSVDEQARRVVFTAAGRDGTDLYQQELYSVSLDGGEITTITADGLDHDPRPSPSGRYFVDVMSRVDVPAISVLREATGETVLELEQADATALYATGWTPPERFTVKAADGVTDINCAIYLPHDFDPTKTYPVVDEIYAGMHISTSPIRFPQSGGTLTYERSGAVFAALGFVVVTVDARGTALRHKAFQADARLNGPGGFVADHVAAIKQLGETRPWMDLDRVGIFGHSGGGYGSTRAMLDAPDFFKVAVSSGGDHDDRVNHSWWGEKFLGMADEYDYELHSNAPHVHRLQGKLLLVHGEMDDNVTPYSTLALVDALIAENKDFDLLIVPNADHSMAHHGAYWIRRRWDYFVQHLMGETPPKYRIADIPVETARLLKPEA